MGIDAIICDVEVNVSRGGMKKTILVGLPQLAVKESTQRVDHAIENSGFPMQARQITINLAPADVKKGTLKMLKKSERNSRPTRS